MNTAIPGISSAFPRLGMLTSRILEIVESFRLDRAKDLPITLSSKPARPLHECPNVAGIFLSEHSAPFKFNQRKGGLK